MESSGGGTFCYKCQTELCRKIPSCNKKINTPKEYSFEDMRKFRDELKKSLEYMKKEIIEDMTSDNPYTSPFETIFMIIDDRFYKPYKYIENYEEPEGEKE